MLTLKNAEKSTLMTVTNTAVIINIKVLEMTTE